MGTEPLRLPQIAALRNGANAAMGGELDDSGADRLTAADIVQRLEEAGATLLALPGTGYSTRMRQMRFDIVHTALEAYGWAAEPVRAPAPDAAAITAMDEAFLWLALIPQPKFVLRRILGARALVHPLTRRHLFPWRRLGAVLGADHKSVQRWHAEGISLVERALR
jgi:hypothetical protein